MLRSTAQSDIPDGDIDQTTGASPFLQVGVKPVNVGLMGGLNAQNQDTDIRNKL